MEGDICCKMALWAYVAFQSTPSAWRETKEYDTYKVGTVAFQSTPSAWRETRSRWSSGTAKTYFNPLPPHGGRLPSAGLFMEGYKNFNPLPPHGGRPDKYKSGVMLTGISIHSLRMEGDRVVPSKKVPLHNISIHSLRMEGDCLSALMQPEPLYFNPLPPHGGRRKKER